VSRLERSAEATAPTRVDLAGAPLDVWPPGLPLPGATAVGVAIDRRVWCRVEPLAEGVRIESKDTLVKHEAASVAALLERESPPPEAFVLGALGIATGVKVSTRSRVPPGSGLGRSSALTVAVAAAGAAATRRELPEAGLRDLVRDVGTRWSGAPPGIEAHLAAIHGGVVAVRVGPGGSEAERLPVDVAAVEECLLLASAGAARSPGPDLWAVLGSRVDGDVATRRDLEEIGSVAARLAEALAGGRLGDVPALLRADWEARKRLAPGVTTPEIDRIAAIASDCGGVARACGAGGGGVVAVWAAPGDRGAGAREALSAALKRAEVPVFPFRADLQGLEVEVE